MFLHFLESACQKRIRQSKIGRRFCFFLGRNCTRLYINFFEKLWFNGRTKCLNRPLVCHLKTEHLCCTICTIQPTWNLFKKTGWVIDICPKIANCGPPKTGTHPQGIQSYYAGQTVCWDVILIFLSKLGDKKDSHYQAAIGTPYFI